MEPDSSVYENLYSASSYGKYEHGSRRLDQVLAWIKKYVSLRSTVLDYGAGRCYLTRRLIQAGYLVAAFEPCAWLWEHDNADLAEYRIRERPELNPIWQWDCVVASDVLEHLPDEAAALDLLGKLCEKAKAWVVITVGIASSNAKANLPGVDVELHQVIKPAAWWRKHVARHVDIVAESNVKKSYLVIGRVKA